MKPVVEKSAERATPRNPEIPEQTIAISSGLKASDKHYAKVPISQIEAYLKKHKDCYERTQPIQDEPTRVLNRVYVDIDGEMPHETSEAAFDTKVDAIKAVFLTIEGVAIKESCKWKCASDDGSVSNKLSFTIHFQELCGTKKAIAHHVKTEIAPMLKRLLKDTIPVLTILKKKAGENHEGSLIIDMSVFNDGQRKMRMLWQTKPLQDRPYKLIAGTVIDTLITYIPTGCETLPEPKSVFEVETSAERATRGNPVVATETSVATTETTDPTDDDAVSQGLLMEVLGALGQHRWDYYPDWIRIGFVMFNEGLPLSSYINLSKKSKHWKSTSADWITQKWKAFRKDNLSQALLWKWLSEDDMDTYLELSKQRKDFWALIKNPSHAEVARFFFNLKPDAYLFNEKLGWFQLLPSNIWKTYEKQPNGLLSDIWHTFTKVVKEHQMTIDTSLTDAEKAKEVKQLVVALMGFLGKIGNKSFCDGVIAFLPSCYNDEDLDKKMDETRHLVAFQDAVYDLDKMEKRSIQPEDYICLNTGYEYPKKRYPEARKELLDTIRSVFEETKDIEGSQEMSKKTSHMLKTLAMSLHGRKKYEKFFVWTGSGGNGKGLLSEMLKRVMGDYYHTVPHQVLTKGQDKKDATCPPLAKAKGKRVVMASEPEADDKLQVGAIKEWTGGDVISARDLYRSTVSFVPQFVLFLQTNNIPQLNRPDGGIQRRLEVDRFPFQFVDTVVEPHHKKINIDLKEKIIKSPEWRDEMWHLLLEAYVLLGKEGLKAPADVDEATAGYIDDQNPIKDWLEANYTMGLDKDNKSFHIETTALRKQYMDMTKHDISTDRFKASMESLRQTQKKHSHDFKCLRWVSEMVNDKWESSWKEGVGRAGKYWCGLKRIKAPMPPVIQIYDD